MKSRTHEHHSPRRRAYARQVNALQKLRANETDTEVAAHIQTNKRRRREDGLYTHYKPEQREDDDNEQYRNYHVEMRR